MKKKSIRVCACGSPSHRLKWGHPVCERCDRLENERRDLEAAGEYGKIELEEKRRLRARLAEHQKEEEVAYGN